MNTCEAKMSPKMVPLFKVYMAESVIEELKKVYTVGS